MNLPILLSKKYRFLALTAFFLLLGIGCSHENAQNAENKTDEVKTEGEETADAETTEEATTEVQSSVETASSTTVASTSTLSSGGSTGSFCPSNFIFSCMVKGTQPETNTEEACRAVYGVPTCKPASASITYCPSGMVIYCPSAYADKMPTAPTFQACYAALSTNTSTNTYCKETQDISSNSCVSDGTHKLCVGYVKPATTTTTTTSTSTTSNTSITSPTSTTSTSSTSTATLEPSPTTTTSPSPASRGKGKK